MAAIDKPGYCALCTSTCGTITTVDDDRIVAVRNNPDHPTGSAMCLKGKSAPELVDSADRLTHPMRRTRPKGDPDPGWERISWDEALDEIAGRMLAMRRESGPESVAFGITTPSGTPMADSSAWVERFVFRYGSPNIVYASELCNFHKEIAHSFTFGRGMPTPDYIGSDLIILWGHNPANTWLAQAHAIGEARKAGAKLIVVDPRETALARDADVWLRVRPGSDAALAMGIANRLIASGRYDAAFMAAWSNGGLLVRESDGALLRGRDLGLEPADALVYWDAEADGPALLPAAIPGQGRPVPAQAARRGRFVLDGPTRERLVCRTAFDLYAEACAGFPLEETAGHCWIDAAAIAAAADLIGASRRVSLHSWTGLEQHTNATQSMRAICCLYALTGSYDREGGNRVFGALPYRTVNDLTQLPAEAFRKALGYAERPIGPAASGWISSREMYRSILDGAPYRVRAFISFGGNLLLSQADTPMAEAAFRALEFHVHTDLFLNPTAAYADIVLPVNTLWEREALRIGFDISPAAAEWVQLRPQMVSRRGEGRSDAEIVFALATRMGLDEAFFEGSLERGWDAMLAPLGLDVETLRRQPEGIRIPLQHPTRKFVATGFATRTGLVEIYSELMLQNGYTALPGFDTGDLLQPCADFPYVLSNAKSGYYCHSQQRNVTSLRKKLREPVLEISGDLADAKGIAEHDWVEVATRTGTARFRARINPSLHPKVLMGQHGWWQACTALGQSETPSGGACSSNFNRLIDTGASDPVSGSVSMRAFVCDVRREIRYGDQPGRWSGYRDFVVDRIDDEVHGVRSLSLRPVGGGSLPAFEPGQHVSIRIDMGVGAPVSRAYSLVGTARQPAAAYTVCVRDTQLGIDSDDPRPSVSTYLNTRIRVGDRIDVQMPGRTFIIPLHSTRPVVLYAGGIGITPFVTALETAASEGSTSDFLLLYNNRNGTTHVFRDRLHALRSALPGLAIIDIYSRAIDTETVGADFDAAGYMSADMVLEDWLRRRALHYICGNTAMIDTLSTHLIDRGVFAFDIFREIFRSPTIYRGSSDDKFQITFSRSAKTLEWTGACGPLLPFAESFGISLPSGCRVGQCENCELKILSGEVLHLHGSEPAETGTCLSCQAVPTSNLLVDA